MAQLWRFGLLLSLGTMMLLLTAIVTEVDLFGGWRCSWSEATLSETAERLRGASKREPSDLTAARTEATLPSPYTASTVAASSAVSQGVSSAETLLPGCTINQKVTWGTIYTPNFDRLSLTRMLSHQIRGASTCGPGLVDVLVVTNPEGSSPEEALQMVDARLPYDLVPTAQALVMDPARRSDPHLLSPFADYAFGYTLDKLLEAHEESGKTQAAQYFQAVLEFILNCKTEFCVWMDMDILVHRAADSPGWLDLALEWLQTHPAAAHISFAYTDLRKPAVNSSHTRFMTNGGLSSRCMVLRRSRVLTARPLHIPCEDDCTFEAVYRVPEDRGGGGVFLFAMTPGPWLTHPPDDTQGFISLLETCGNGSLDLGLQRMLDLVERKELVDENLGLGWWQPRDSDDADINFEGETLDLSSLQLDCGIV